MTLVNDHFPLYKEHFSASNHRGEERKEKKKTMSPTMYVYCLFSFTLEGITLVHTYCSLDFLLVLHWPVFVSGLSLYETDDITTGGERKSCA